MRWSPQVNNTVIAIAAAALYGFVVGFGYGDLFASKHDFHLQDWQTLTGALVAIAAALLAYLGVRGTQRVNVMLREEDRIDKAIPGLQQTNDLLSLLLKHAGGLEDRILYLAREPVRDIVRPQDNENYEAITKRLLPLADAELQRDVTAVLFRLMTQAEMLKVVKEGLDQAYVKRNNIHEYAPSSHQAVRDEVERIEGQQTKERENFRSIVESLRKLNTSIEERIHHGGERRKLIRQTLDKYFREW